LVVFFNTKNKPTTSKIFTSQKEKEEEEKIESDGEVMGEKE